MKKERLSLVIAVSSLILSCIALYFQFFYVNREVTILFQETSGKFCKIDSVSMKYDLTYSCVIINNSTEPISILDYRFELVELEDECESILYDVFPINQLLESKAIITLNPTIRIDFDSIRNQQSRCLRIREDDYLTSERAIMVNLWLNAIGLNKEGIGAYKIVGLIVVDDDRLVLIEDPDNLQVELY